MSLYIPCSSQAVSIGDVSSLIICLRNQSMQTSCGRGTDHAYELDSITMTLDETTDYSARQSDINTYVTEQIPRFILESFQLKMTGMHMLLKSKYRHR